MSTKLTDEQMAALLPYRRKLRAARAVVQADAEAYKAVSDVVESLVRHLKYNDFGVPEKHRAMCVILDILFPDSSADLRKSVRSMYERLREARNALVHEGAVSRTLGAHAVRLSLAMEEAIMTNAKTPLDDQSVEGWMVREPVVAQPWQKVSEIRVALLSGGYSALPVWWDEEKPGRWRCSGGE